MFNRITLEEFKILTVTMIVATCGMLGIDIHLASLPNIMTYLHTDKPHMQQSISIFLLGMGSSLLFYGPLSDKYGRKPIVVFGLTFAAIASFLTILSTNIHMFLFFRLLQGIGSGVCMGVGRTILADVLQGERFASIGSYFTMFLSLSPIIAPALGGYVQEWFGWKTNFILLGTILGSVMLLYFFLCPETNKHINSNPFSIREVYQNYKSLLLHPVFVSATLITGLASAANMAYPTISPFVFQIQFHLSPVDYGLITAIAGISAFIGRFITPVSINRLGIKKTLHVGLLLLVMAGVWILFFIFLKLIDVPLIMIAVFIAIFGQSFIFPIVASFALSPFHEKRGAAGALYGSFQMLTAFLSTAIIGLFARGGIIVLGTAYLILGAIGTSIYLRFLKNETLFETPIEKNSKNTN